MLICKSHINQKLQDFITLKHKYITTNTRHFADSAVKMKLKLDHKMLTMDIKDLYVNLPIRHTLNITKKLLQNNRVEEQTLKEIMTILKLVANQNYFQYEDKYYKPETGVAMGSPISSIMVEIFLQEIEQHQLKHILEDRKIIYYNRYVDDIFLIYNRTKTTPQRILECLNTLHKDLQFTLNEETNNLIAYLDLELTNKKEHLELKIYRKPTTTDTTINIKSCHPKEQKLAAYKNWILDWYSHVLI
jgi:hypothetical protein